MLYVPCINEYCIIENLGIFKEQYNSLNEMVETWMEKSELAEGLLKVAQIQQNSLSELLVSYSDAQDMEA